MEGVSEKIELGNQGVVNPSAVEISTIDSFREIPSEEVQHGQEPIEEYPEGDYPEEYPEGEYPEEYLEEEYPDDENWEADVGGSEPSPLGGLYGLFKDVSRQLDTKRVSNLTKEELGIWNLSVRDCERIALIADTFHHPGVAKFFIKQSRIVTDTAMSKMGWFTELFITSKKFASRDSSSSIANLPQYNKKSKWRVFSEKDNQPVQEQVQ